MASLSYVYLGRLWEREPVYHDYGRIGDDKNSDITACGLLIYESGHYPAMVHIREDHAEKFARPCRRCFVVEKAA